MKPTGLIEFAFATLIAGALATAPAVAQKAADSKAKTSTGAPAKKAAPAKIAKPTVARTQKAAAKKATTKKPPSVCKGLSKTACGANKSCGWVDYKKKTSSNGRKLTDHCRLVAGAAKSKKKQ